ncbi:MAG TPA: DUF1653 domain-containing protein [Geomonas sp.]|nr:DUF1653 domain-containing protein [Geomonas sp.]
MGRIENGDDMAGAAHQLRPGRYRHYKGNYYEVIGIARHSETEEEMVVYRKLYGDHSLWVRPLAMFLEEIEINGRLLPRFAPVDE